jgi:hypothetical protein
VSLPIEFENNGEAIFGWSVAVCHDPDVVTLDEVVDGSLIATVNEGDEPAFQDVTIYEDGFVAGVIICLTSCDQLDSGDSYTLYEATYVLEGLAPATAAIEFCEDSLPALSNEVVIEGGTGVTPDREAGSIEILGPEPLYYEISTADATIYYDRGDGVAIFDQNVLILENSENPSYPNAIEAFQVALGHDGILLEATGVSQGADLADVGGGVGADFFSVEIFDDGVFVDVVVAELAADGLLADTAAEALTVTYEGTSSLLQVNPFGFVTDLTFDAELPTPPPRVRWRSPGFWWGSSSSGPR